MAPIHDAARAGDTEALRRELERGVSPDAHAASVLGNLGSTPLFIASGHSRADCVRILLQAGADPNARVLNTKATALHAAAGAYATAANSDCELSRDCIRMLLEAGASVNVRTTYFLWTAMDYVYNRRQRTHSAVYPLLLRAGSELPKEEMPGGHSGWRPVSEHPYLGRIMEAGGFKNYEGAHREALTRTLSPKLALPPELVRTVVEFYLHAGFYPFTEVPATAPTATA